MRHSHRRGAALCVKDVDASAVLAGSNSVELKHIRARDIRREERLDQSFVLAQVLWVLCVSWKMVGGRRPVWSDLNRRAREGRARWLRHQCPEKCDVWVWTVLVEQTGKRKMSLIAV